MGIFCAPDGLKLRFLSSLTFLSARLVGRPCKTFASRHKPKIDDVGLDSLLRPLWRGYTALVLEQSTAKALAGSVLRGLWVLGLRVGD